MTITEKTQSDMILPLYVNEYSTHFYSFESINNMDKIADVEIVVKQGDVPVLIEAFGGYETLEVISKEKYTHVINANISIEVPFSICFISRNFLSGKFCIMNSNIQCHKKAKFDTMESAIEFCKRLMFVQIYCKKNKINMQVI